MTKGQGPMTFTPLGAVPPCQAAFYRGFLKGNPCRNPCHDPYRTRTRAVLGRENAEKLKSQSGKREPQAKAETRKETLKC